MADVTDTARAAARIDLAAIRANAAHVRERAGGAELMAVVKADGYGHGIVPSARAALDGGATWLGVAFAEEALALRDAGIDAPILSWLAVPGERLEALVAARVDLSASAPWAIDEIAGAARTAGTTARVHLKADTGLSRGGATPADWPDLVDAALKAQAGGAVELIGIWSHLVHGDESAHPTTAAQMAAFTEALDVAERAGARPQLRHLANSGGTLGAPDTRFDLVRCGISIYGLNPAPGHIDAEPLRPAMTLSARLALVKDVPAGTGVSYGHRYVTAAPTRLGLVPLGYADGVPRAATNTADVLVRTAGGPLRRRISGTVCMDQFVVDLGAGVEAAAGDEVLLFGPGDDGEPTAQEWADALGTISYEIVTRIGARVPREYVDE